MMHSPFFSALLMALVLHVVGLVTVSQVWRGLGASLPPSARLPIFAHLVPVEPPPEPLPELELTLPPPPGPEMSPVRLPVPEVLVPLVPPPVVEVPPSPPPPLEKLLPPPPPVKALEKPL